jgi:methylmalonyl-CoA/ethylmalonyl-CoA epimerase
VHDLNGDAQRSFPRRNDVPDVREPSRARRGNERGSRIARGTKLEPMITRIDHVGIAVRSLSESVKYYETALGLACERVEDVPSQNVRTAFFDVGGVHLELLEPTSPESAIARFLEKRGEGIHHIAFATEDISGALAQARNAGALPIQAKPFEGAAGKLVAFLHPKFTGGVLTELCMPTTTTGRAAAHG